MLRDSCGDGENVRVEDDVRRIEADVVDENLVGARGNGDLTLDGVSLSLLVEGHDDHGRAVAANQLCLSSKRLLALLEGDRVHDRLALRTLHARFEDRPTGGAS